MPYKNTKEKKKAKLSTFFNKSLQVSALKIKRKITEQKKNKCKEGHACVCTCTRALTMLRGNGVLRAGWRSGLSAVSAGAVEGISAGSRSF